MSLIFHSKVNADGQVLFSMQLRHFGFFAVHTLLPSEISRSVILIHLLGGTIVMRSVSILFGSSFCVSPRRAETRRTWVSTAMPSTIP